MEKDTLPNININVVVVIVVVVVNWQTFCKYNDFLKAVYTISYYVLIIWLILTRNVEI